MLSLEDVKINKNAIIDTLMSCMAWNPLLTTMYGGGGCNGSWICNYLCN